MNKYEVVYIDVPESTSAWHAILTDIIEADFYIVAEGSQGKAITLWKITKGEFVPNEEVASYSHIRSVRKLCQPPDTNVGLR